MSSIVATVSKAPKKQDVDTGIPAKDRERIAKDLGQVLGDTYLLLVKTHVYHWNVVGPIFLPIHELTEQHYNDLFKASDELAERIRALGLITPLSFASMSKTADIEEASKAVSAEAMVEDLIDDHEAMVKAIRKIAKNAEESNDFVTHDLLVGRMAFHEKAIWMLRAIVA